MNDKTAIINAAQKFAAKGLIDKAISEWEKLLKDRNDGNIHNTIGDLYLKKGADQEAVKSFNKAAEIFKKDGFYPKSIAIYKKVLNIVPNDADTLLALAKLHADRGLTGNAIDNYHRAAEIYNKEGSTEKAIMVVDKMLHLSPTNPSTRSKIAYLYFKLGLRERAANEYAAIASDCLKDNDVEKAKEFFDKSVEYDPSNVSALIGLSKLALRSNNPAQASETLDNALSLAPNNKEVLAAYARLALDMGRKDDAKRTLAQLSELDPSSIETKKLLGTVYLEEGLIQKAFEELLPVIDDALDAEKWSEAHELLNNFRDLQTLPVKKRLLRICRAQGDDYTIGNELKELAALHENEGANEDALKLFKEALALNADDKAASEKINELEIKLGILPPAPDRESALGEHINIEAIAIPPDEEAASVEENLLTKSGFEEKLDTPAETAAEQYTSLEINIMPDEHDEEMNPAQEHQAMPAEEFAVKKAEADFYLQQGLEDEAIEIYESLISAFPDNKEIAIKLTSLKSVDQRPDHMHAEKSGEGPSLQTSADDDLQELFARLEKPEEKAIDYEAHYVAGLDFKQKGLLDKAINELRVASRDPDKLQRNSTMLALCYMEKKSYPLAIAEFNKIIATMTPHDSTYLHIKYELANAHMNNKEVNRALELYFEIHAMDPDFKDLSAKIASLKGQKAKSPEDIPRPKRDRVSYI
jgi:tetratricopeptide (TPR) repeat protein